MKEKPILFSAPMVRAILEGRKTQTRRVINPQPESNPQGGALVPLRPTCPYGYIGDRLWVRETWCDLSYNATRGCLPLYRVDGEEKPPELKWRSAMFMPRFASRITLEIAEARIQRVQEISEEDAITEGIRIGHYYCDEPDLGNNDPDDCGVHRCQPREDFRILWDSINAKNHPWASNPWVWCLSFRRVQ